MPEIILQNCNHSIARISFSKFDYLDIHIFIGTKDLSVLKVPNISQNLEQDSHFLNVKDNITNQVINPPTKIGQSERAAAVSSVACHHLEFFRTVRISELSGRCPKSGDR